MIVQILFLILAGANPNPAFIEENGRVEIEAESFHTQLNDSLRSWQIISEANCGSETDPDSVKYLTASGNSYLKLLPDTRVTHDDELIHGINFSNEPGLSILEYKVHFSTPAKYYVWVRAFSTGSEDNGIHVGLDGKWPESGQRMQWCEGKNLWTWESKQRTTEVHCGEPEKIFLEIKEAGEHTIQFSMREDGFAFDRFVLSTQYEKPVD
jgi:hypothetical protein